MHECVGGVRYVSHYVSNHGQKGVELYVCMYTSPQVLGFHICVS